jgi:hypothetical protein
MLWGLSAALSLIVIVAVRAPFADGENVTLTRHDAPAASVLVLMGQVLVSLKSPALAPPRLMLEMVSAVVPVFVRDTV